MPVLLGLCLDLVPLQLRSLWLWYDIVPETSFLVQFRSKVPALGHDPVPSHT